MPSERQRAACLLAIALTTFGIAGRAVAGRAKSSFVAAATDSMPRPDAPEQDDLGGDTALLMEFGPEPNGANPGAPRLPLPVDGMAARSLRACWDLSLARTAQHLISTRAQSENDRLGRMIVRGMGGSRVLLLDRGLPVFDFQLPDVDGLAVDPRGAARVDVTRGPLSSIHGTDALGGVIETAFEQIQVAESGGSETHSDAELYGASGDRGAGGAVRLRGARGPYGWRIAGAGGRAQRLSTPSGALEPFDTQALNGEVAAGWVRRDRRAELRYTRFGGTFDLPLQPGAGGARSLDRDLDDRRLQWSGSAPFAGLTVETRGQWQHRTLDAAVRNDPHPPLSMWLDAYTGEILARRVTSRWSASGGVSGFAQQSASREPRPLVPDAHVISGAVFAAAGVSGPKWTATGAARLDARHLEATHEPTLALPTQSRSFDFLSGNLGATYALSGGLGLSANVGRAFRSPTLLELYAHGAPLGRDRYELGDRGLGLERGLGMDVGAAWRRERLWSRVTLFREHIADFVDLDASGEVLDALPVYRYGARKATFLGSEAAIEYGVRRSIAVGGVLDYVRGTDETNDLPLSSIPTARWILHAEANRPGWWQGSNARLRLELEGHGRATRLGALDRPADPYLLLNLQAELSWERSRGTYRAAVFVDNLADERYRDFLARDPAIAPGQGRRITLRVSVGS